MRALVAIAGLFWAAAAAAGPAVNTALKLPKGFRPDPSAEPPLYVSEHPCTPFDLRKDHGAPYAKLPVLDQAGKVNMCSAYAVSSFVDGLIQSRLPERTSHVTSPFVVNLQLARALGLKDFDKTDLPDKARSVDALIEQIRLQGSCNHLKVFGPGIGKADSGLLKILDGGRESFRAFLRDRESLMARVDRGESFNQILGSALAPISRELQCQMTEHGLDSLEVPGRLARDASPALMRVLYDPAIPGGGSQVDSLTGYFDQACQGETLRVPIPEVVRETLRGDDAERSVARLHELMDRPVKDPIHISFCGRVLELDRPFKAYFEGQDAQCENPLSTKPEAVKRALRVRAFQGLPDPKPRPTPPLLKSSSQARHAAVIIGRRREADGSCRVLLRNSWGKSCGAYEKAGWGCEDGNVWIDIRDLSENAYEIRHFKR